MSTDRSAAGPDLAATLPPAAAPVTLPASPAAAVGDHVSIPGYEVVAELGRGGMGVVYRARQVGLNRDVALKMILAGGHASAIDLARFRSEAEAVARLQHPNVVQVYEVGEAGGLPYFSLEFCPGGSLERQLNGVPQPPKRAAALIETLARAIFAAHQAGIVHRDLKPGNVLLTTDGTPKVTDFGLAKQLDSGSGRTATGAILGTPSYMAPEQANSSKEIGSAADTYALGAILYELLTGRPPFRAATHLDTVLQVVSEEPVPPTRLNPQVPRDLETIALKCLQKDPAKRYASAVELADDLRRWQAGEPITARPAGMIEKVVKWTKRRPTIVGLVAAVVLAVVAGFAGVLYELRMANDARTRAETQEGLANQRADDLAREQVRVRRELHRSDILRADLLLQANEFPRAEQVLWRSHFIRPDDDDRRAYWRLWELYHQRPRRSGAWIGASDLRSISPDGRRVAVVNESRVMIRDAATGAGQTEFTTSQTKLGSVTFSRDGHRLGLLSVDDRSIAVWDLDPRPVLRATLRPTAPTRTDPMLALGASMNDFSPEQLRQVQRSMSAGQTRLCFLNGDRVLVTDADSAQVWKLDGPVVVTRLELEPVSMLSDPFGSTSILRPSTGDTIAVVRAGAVQLWVLPRTAGEPITRTQLDFTDPVRFRRGPPVAPKSTFAGAILGSDRRSGTSAVALSCDGKWLITNDSHFLRVWDAVSGEKRGEVEGDETIVNPTEIAVTTDGRMLWRTGSDSIQLRRLPGLEPVRTIPRLGIGGYRQIAALSPDGRQTSVAEGKTVAIYDHQPVATVRPLFSADQAKRGVRGSDLAAAGPVVTLEVAFKGITAWNGGRADQIKAPRNLIELMESQCAISPTGAAAASLRSSPFGNTATIYDLTARRVVGSVALTDPERGVARLVGAIAFTPDGRTLAVSTERGLMLVNVGTVKIVRVFRAVKNTGFGIVFGPDGRSAAYRDMKEMVLLDIVTGRELARIAADGTEHVVGFAPDGKILATRAERRLILRDAATFAQVGEIPASVADLGAGAFAPDGGMIATGGRDGKLRLWDVRRREDLVAIDLGAGSITKVVFTPDGAKVRFIADKQIGEFDLHAYDPYVDGNLNWNLQRLLPELDPAEADRVRQWEKK